MVLHIVNNSKINKIKTKKQSFLLVKKVEIINIILYNDNSRISKNRGEDYVSRRKK